MLNVLKTTQEEAILCLKSIKEKMKVLDSKRMKLLDFSILAKKATKTRLENLRVVYLPNSQNYLNVSLFYKYVVQLVHYAVAEFSSKYNCTGSIMTTAPVT